MGKTRWWSAIRACATAYCTKPRKRRKRVDIFGRIGNDRSFVLIANRNRQRSNLNNVRRRSQAMTKAELVEAVAKTAKITKVTATVAVDATFEQIGKAIRKSKRFQVPGFGPFTVRSRKARKGRNPQTGAVINIKASRSVGFKPAPVLKKGL